MSSQGCRVENNYAPRLNSGTKQCVAVPVKDHSTSRITSSLPTGRIPRQTGRPEYLAYKY